MRDLQPPTGDNLDEWNQYLDSAVGPVEPLDNPNTWTLATNRVYEMANGAWVSRRIDPDEPDMAYLDTYDFYDMDGFTIEHHDIKRGARLEAYGTKYGDVISNSYKLDPEVESAKWMPFITERHPIEYRVFPNLEVMCSIDNWERDDDGRVYDPQWVRNGSVEHYVIVASESSRRMSWSEWRKKVDEAA